MHKVLEILILVNRPSLLITSVRTLLWSEVFFIYLIWYTCMKKKQQNKNDKLNLGHNRLIIKPFPNYNVFKLTLKSLKSYSKYFWICFFLDNTMFWRIEQDITDCTLNTCIKTRKTQVCQVYRMIITFV